MLMLSFCIHSKYNYFIIHIYWFYHQEWLRIYLCLIFCMFGLHLDVVLSYDPRYHWLCVKHFSWNIIFKIIVKKCWVRSYSSRENLLTSFRHLRTLEIHDKSNLISGYEFFGVTDITQRGAIVYEIAFISNYPQHTAL